MGVVYGIYITWELKSAYCRRLFNIGYKKETNLKMISMDIDDIDVIVSKNSDGLYNRLQYSNNNLMHTSCDSLNLCDSKIYKLWLKIMNLL